jgi:hypothetical protein
MSSRNVLVALAVVVAWCTPCRAQLAEAPVVLGTLAGAGSPQRPQGLRLYGTDLGWTFSHRDQLYILFGDSWADADSLCSVLTDGLPTNDDSQGFLPRRYDGGVPEVSFATAGRASVFDPTRVLRDGVSLPMGANRTALTGFSDGRRAWGVFQSAAWVACRAAPSGDPSCPAPLACNARLGLCSPSPFGIPQICDVERQVGCLPGQTCEPNGPGYCVDPTSSQPDPVSQVALELEWSTPAPSRAAQWSSRYTQRTNKFLNVTARTVRRVDGSTAHADYAPGKGSLLMWGRPGFYGGPGTQTGLYLLTHELPLPESENGTLALHPRYFAGLDARGRPSWSEREQDAAPLALDGMPGGASTELYPVPNQQTISWLGAPVRKWVMLYGGGPLIGDSGVMPGFIALRYADQPWGPWSAPQVHLSEGAADQPNTPRGPGGVLYDPQCVDHEGLTCARTDPVRPRHILNETCAAPEVETDVGYFYAPNIIEEYTQRGRDYVDVYWNLSAWNPYRVLFLRTRFRASAQPSSSTP